LGVILQALNVSKWYRTGRRNEVRAVDDVSVEIMENQTVVLYGPSGSGKTTLLGLLGTIDRPSSGKILLKGQDTTRFSDVALSRVRRKTIGIVFQSFNLFSRMPAWENATYPLVPTGMTGKERYALGRRFLERLGLGDRLHHTPEELSGGEQQRVAIARALINDPEILIADEPTSNIDADSIRMLLEILDELKREGKTLLISSHDPAFMNYGDLRYNLDRGKLAIASDLGDKRVSHDP